LPFPFFLLTSYLWAVTATWISWPKGLCVPGAVNEPSARPTHLALIHSMPDILGPRFSIGYPQLSPLISHLRVISNPISIVKESWGKSPILNQFAGRLANIYSQTTENDRKMLASCSFVVPNSSTCFLQFQ